MLSVVECGIWICLNLGMLQIGLLYLPHRLTIRDVLVLIIQDNKYVDIELVIILITIFTFVFLFLHIQGWLNNLTAKGLSSSHISLSLLVGKPSTQIIETLSCGGDTNFKNV